MTINSNDASDAVARTVRAHSAAAALLEDVEVLDFPDGLDARDYRAAAKAIQEIRELRSLVARPEQVKRVEQMQGLLEPELAELQTSRTADEGAGAGPFIGALPNAENLASLRSLIEDFIRVEDSALVDREAAVRRARLITHALIMACLALAAASILATLSMNGAHVRSLTRELRLRAEAEANAARLQRMESLGQLAAGVAHDFNNLLTVVIANLEVMKRKGAEQTQDIQFVRAADRAMRGAERGALLTNRLLAFSKKQALRPQAANINAVVGELIDILSSGVGKNIRIETVLKPDAWDGFVDVSGLENALLNLVLNARDAMPDGGRITIGSGNETLDEAFCASCDNLAPGDYVALSVSDTGAGMTDEVRERALEPFFTTKEAGRGAGLGLAMIHGFVKQSRGHIEIWSRPGEGTTVKIYLPRLARAEA
jgi:signal transduction histidine kinase